MPLYPIDCPCGSDEGWSRKALPSDATEVECFECDRVNPITTIKSHQLAAIHGLTWNTEGSKGRYVKQAGRYFSSRKELEAWADKKGMELVSNTDSRWRAVREENREHADKDAKAEGFRDAEDRRAQIKENSREFRLQAAEKVIDRYTEEHGSEGKQTPEQLVAQKERKAAG